MPCRINLDVKLAKIVVKNLMKLKYNHLGLACSFQTSVRQRGGGMMQRRRRVREQMKERQMNNESAFSIESSELLAKGKPFISQIGPLCLESV